MPLASSIPCFRLVCTSPPMRLSSRLGRSIPVYKAILFPRKPALKNSSGDTGGNLETSISSWSAFTTCMLMKNPTSGERERSWAPTKEPTLRSCAWLLVYLRSTNLSLARDRSFLTAGSVLVNGLRAESSGEQGPNLSRAPSCQTAVESSILISSWRDSLQRSHRFNFKHSLGKVAVPNNPYLQVI